LTEFFRQVGGVENCLKFFSRGAAFMDFEPASGTKNGDTPLPHTSESRVPRVVCKNALQNLHVKELGYQNLENKEFSRGGWALWAPASAAAYVDAD
jgi:hypothetical protein